MSIDLQVYEKIFEEFSLFFDKSKWRPNHVTNQYFGLNIESASHVDGAFQMSCPSVCNLMRRRFFKDLASFSKNQNGGQTTWQPTFWAQTCKCFRCRWCMQNFMSIGLQLYEKKIFQWFSLFFEKWKWRPNHVTNQLFGLKLVSASYVDGVCQISCQSVCNFMRRRFLNVLASFSKNQNGGQTTWPVNFLSSNLKGLCM